MTGVNDGRVLWEPIVTVCYQALLTKQLFKKKCWQKEYLFVRSMKSYTVVYTNILSTIYTIRLTVNGSSQKFLLLNDKIVLSVNIQSCL